MNDKLETHQSRYFWKKSGVWAKLRELKQRYKSTPPLPARKTVLDDVSRILDNSGTTPLVTVITPTTGSSCLAEAIASVQNQNFEDVMHLIVVDGAEYEQEVRKITAAFDPHKLRVVTLPFNTGRNGMNGHRIYAAFPFLINSEYVFFLDEDNWLDPNHISSIVSSIQANSLDWAFSFRKIYTQEGDYVCADHCESIGDYPAYSGKRGLVDTNCYGFTRNALVKASSYWYHPLGADRYFFQYLKKIAPKFQSTGLFTTNYRLSNKRPPDPDYFIEGNRYMCHSYNNKLPWLDQVG